MDREAEIDRLYALPLAEFVAARNALARELRQAGDREAASAIQALPKPGVTAWAVNRLWHAERGAFERLLAAGAAAREALAAGGDAREAVTERRAALQELLSAARRELAEAGHSFTPAARQRVSHSLEALAAQHPSAHQAPPGRLTRDLEPPGFEALAGLALPTPAGALRPARKSAARGAARKDPAKRGAAAPKARGKATERRLAAARQAVAERREEMAKLEEKVTAARGDLAEAKRLAAAAVAAADEVEERARAAAERAAEARREEAGAARRARAADGALRRASAKLETARRRLARLT